VAYFLRARAVEPEKQSLIGNGCVTHNNRVTVGIDIFYAVRTETIQRGPAAITGKEEPCVEEGLNTSTVTLRVVRGDKKGSLESETVKYGLETQGTQTRARLRWQGPAAYTKDRPVLFSERAPHKIKAVTVKQ
jgi:hypothetical protein